MIDQAKRGPVMAEVVIRESEDGIWIEFVGSKFNQAVVNLDSMAGRGPIGDVIREWAEAALAMGPDFVDKFSRKASRD